MREGGGRSSYLTTHRRSGARLRQRAMARSGGRPPASRPGLGFPATTLTLGEPGEKIHPPTFWTPTHPPLAGPPDRQGRRLQHTKRTILRTTEDRGTSGWQEQEEARLENPRSPLTGPPAGGDPRPKTEAAPRRKQVMAVTNPRISE